MPFHAYSKNVVLCRGESGPSSISLLLYVAYGSKLQICAPNDRIRVLFWGEKEFQKSLQ